MAYIAVDCGLRGDKALLLFSVDIISGLEPLCILTVD